MKTLQLASLIGLALSVVLWTAGRTLFPLPDWAVRANGVVMLAAMSLLVFSTVRQKVKNS
ncbi:MAG: hypothetical protein HFF20_01880 [Oscillospiraceae bacterium]|jgi:hypothetical protein|nr:hypothetical protein [Oscillospiraceae bacterium]MCI9307947.1 hypothetical protein [Oscillospiraceae bacterium]MCI9547966.1 hypothetical protein [Oscillospiraceae bacterium]